MTTLRSQLFAALAAFFICSIARGAFAARAVRAEESQKWQVPDVAWSRVLGDVPEGAAGRDKTRRGIPLGGIGAGNFMYNISGTFGPWEMAPGKHRDVFPPQGAFHYREATASGISAVTLASEGVMPAWKTLSPWQAMYSALYPKGWVSYDGLGTNLSLKFFSPVIRKNYKETSYPASVFAFLIENSSNEAKTISLALTFPNADLEGRATAGDARAFQDPETLATGVEMRNRSGREKIGWAISTFAGKGLDVTWSTNWSADGDGADWLTDFLEDGTLNGSVNDSTSAGSLAVTFRLAPGEKRVVPFAITWSSPIVHPGVAEGWLRKYTEYYGGKSSAASTIAVDALANWEEWERKVNAWVDPIARNKELPKWLRQAAFNELYYGTFGGVFWESGCEGKHSEPGKTPLDNKYFCMECNDYPFMETLDVRHYENRHMTLLWPEIEKTVLENWADMIMENATGETPHDAGLIPIDSPFRNPGYGTTPLPWKDLPSRYIQQVWGYIRATGDAEILHRVWPAIQKTYDFMKSTDTDGDRLPNNEGSDNTYDAFGLQGTSMLCGGLWVGALKAVEKMADVIHEYDTAEEAREWLKDAQTNLDKQLWDEAGKYYRIDTGSKYATAIMADALNGQRYVETSDLGEILPLEKMQKHYWKIFKNNVVPFKDYDGDGAGDVGAVNAIMPDGSPVGAHQSDEVWTGTTYFLAASMYSLGKRLKDRPLMDAALEMAHGVYFQTWENPETAYWFDTPEAWQASDPIHYRALQYQRPRAIWELLLAIEKDPFGDLHKQKKAPRDFFYTPF